MSNNQLLLAGNNPIKSNTLLIGKTGSGTLKIWLREQMVQEISFQVIEKVN